MEAAEKPARKRRTQAEKVGRLKYILYRIHRIERKIDRLDARTRTIFAGLRDFMAFDTDYIRDVLCKDDLDEAILQRLLEVGDGGILPSQIAQDLSKFKISRWYVTRRIQRMNKKLRKELGQNAAEKRGHRWALTSFMRSIWGATPEEIKQKTPE